MKTEAQKSKFIFNGREIAKVLSSLAAFDAGYVATGADTAITDADFTGVNDGLVVADMVALQTIVQALNAEISSVPGRNTVIENYKNV